MNKSDMTAPWSDKKFASWETKPTIIHVSADGGFYMSFTITKVQPESEFSHVKFEGYTDEEDDTLVGNFWDKDLQKLMESLASVWEEEDETGPSAMMETRFHQLRIHTPEE